MWLEVHAYGQNLQERMPKLIGRHECTELHHASCPWGPAPALSLQGHADIPLTPLVASTHPHTAHAHVSRMPHMVQRFLALQHAVHPRAYAATHLFPGLPFKA